MYIAPSSGHISLNFNMPFKLILRRFQVVFWYLEWELMLFSLKDWWKFIQIHQYYTMALNMSTKEMCTEYVLARQWLNDILASKHYQLYVSGSSLNTQAY